MLNGLTIHRICLHEVFRALDNGASSAPKLSNQLLCLDAAELKMLRSRIMAAFKSTAQYFEMSIVDEGVGSVFSHTAALTGADTTNFIHATQSIARKLAQTQRSRTIPGGMVLVFNGSVGASARPCFGIMKAELHEGFTKGLKTQTHFIKDLFLSPEAALYKIGLFVSQQDSSAISPGQWSAFVHDNHAEILRTHNVDDNFWRIFLGLELPKNAHQQVKKFFQYTQDFIEQAHITSAYKIRLRNSLHTYLRAHQAPLVQVSVFSDTYMDDDLADKYEKYMSQKDFPMTAIPKDISEIEDLLTEHRKSHPQPNNPTSFAKLIKGFVSLKHIIEHDGPQTTHLNIHGEMEVK